MGKPAEGATGKPIRWSLSSLNPQATPLADPADCPHTRTVWRAGVTTCRRCGEVRP